MKILLDFLPVVLFFAAYKVWDLFAATAVLMVATAVLVGWGWWRTRCLERMPLVTLVVVLGLGALTLVSHDETFIKWKPTLVNWAFATAFLGAVWYTGRPLIQHLMGTTLTLPDTVWRQLNRAWIWFFVAAGAANLAVAYSFDTETWVDFKMFGMLGITVVFVVAQGFWLARHLPDEPLRKE